MFLGVEYIWWLLMLGCVAVFLALKPKKKPGPNISQEQIDAYVKDLSEAMEMRWFKVTAPSEQVSEVLNKVEVAKITVMYQFFLNEKTGLYDLFFRCRRADLDRMKGIMKDFI